MKTTQWQKTASVTRVGRYFYRNAERHLIVLQNWMTGAWDVRREYSSYTLVSATTARDAMRLADSIT